MQKRTIRVLDSGPVAGSNVPGRGALNGEGSATVCFGVFELDLRTGQLRRNGSRVKLQEQPFQVLAQLLEKPGEVVTREDLRERLWPADTFVDFDHSLNAAIRRLRDALGDSAENPIFVETAARRGYRFLAPVTSKPTIEDVEVIPVAEPIKGSTASRLGYWMGAGLAAVVLVLLGVKLGMLVDRAHLPSQVHISQLTANPEDDRVRASAISRDGRYLAFSDERGFYLRQIDTGETHSVALPENLKAASISWFPDNAHIIVALSAPGQRSSLWELSALGGSARKLLEDGNSPAVSPSGKEIAFLVWAKLHQEIWLMQADGSQSQKLIGDEGDLFAGVAWSPDGTKLICTHARLDYGHSGNESIEALQVHGQIGGSGPPAQINKWRLSGLEGPLAWASDGHLIYAVIEQPPNPPDSNLWSVEVNERGIPTDVPVRLTSGTGNVFSISITTDAKRITYLKGVPQPDVYVAEVKRPGSISEPQRLTFEEHKDIPYDWTPDNREIIFASDRAGTLSIYKQSTDQPVPDLLVRSNRPLMEPRLSPDGTQIIYVERPNWGENEPPTSLMRTPLVGGAPQRILEAKWITNQQCARAPAAICIYSVSGDRSLTFFSFDPFKGKGGQVFRIEEASPFYNWSLSPDGATLALAKAKTDEPSRIHLVPLNGTPEKWLSIPGWPGLASLDWAADSKSLWAPSTGDEQNTLLNIDLQGQVRAVWQPRKKFVGWAIPSRDGRFLALHVGSTSANAWMLEHH
jgi:DNA-binding winged helix-turn-helix (wHTH) protein/Tol biopolymer transport system component